MDMMELKCHVNNKIGEIRKARDFTQETLARSCSISRVTIARYETGKRSPSIDMLARMAIALNVNVCELIELDSNDAATQLLLNTYKEGFRKEQKLQNRIKEMRERQGKTF